jgi:para-nitrobenzyl esterase
MLSLVLALAVIISTFQEVVHTDKGVIVGFRDGNVRQWLGVPYAEPPVGDLRFSPTREKRVWSGTWNATQYSATCFQPTQRSTPLSEDCLYLNVFSPVGGDNLPVMVWIHGGSFTTGSGDIYHGGDFVKQQNVVLITLNYRLGVFGFLHDDNMEYGSGLHGVLDQRMALEWVRKNVHLFGGNPRRITLFGESAGGSSVIFHLAMTRKDLFQRAIIQSGPVSYFSREQAGRIGKEFLAEIKCIDESLKCLRSRSSQEIMSAQMKMTPMSLSNIPLFRPVLHDIELPKSPLDMIESGTFHRVPILVGTNLHEMTWFLCPKWENLTIPEYVDYIKKEFGVERSQRIFATYLLSTYPSPKDALDDVLSDYIFRCDIRKLARSASKYVSVHMYSFEFYSGFSDRCRGVSHVHEIPYIFPSILKVYFGGYKLNQNEEKFGVWMKKQWFNFVAGLVDDIPRFDPQRSNYVQIKDDNLIPKDGFRNGFCQ